MGTSIAALAASRQRMWDSFNSREFDDEKIDLPELERINSVEAKIVEATFETDEDKLAGFMILFERNDPPCFADQFKQKLFAQLHK